MANTSNEVQTIQRRMAEIRRELHEDVREVVASAEAVADWRRYIREYPWPALGAAFALGYVIVPKRKKKPAVEAVAQAAVEQIRERAQAVGKSERVKSAERKGLIAAAWALAAPIAIRAAQSYAVQYLENWIMQQHQQTAAAGPSDMHNVR